MAKYGCVAAAARHQMSKYVLWRHRHHLRTPRTTPQLRNEWRNPPQLTTPLRNEWRNEWRNAEAVHRESKPPTPSWDARQPWDIDLWPCPHCGLRATPTATALIQAGLRLIRRGWMKLSRGDRARQAVMIQDGLQALQMPEEGW